MRWLARPFGINLLGHDEAYYVDESDDADADAGTEIERLRARVRRLERSLQRIERMLSGSVV